MRLDFEPNRQWNSTLRWEGVKRIPSIATPVAASYLSIRLRPSLMDQRCASYSSSGLGPIMTVKRKRWPAVGGIQTVILGSERQDPICWLDAIPGSSPRSKTWSPYYRSNSLV